MLWVGLGCVVLCTALIVTNPRNKWGDDTESRDKQDYPAVWVKDAVETAVGDLEALNDGLVYCDLEADGWLEK